MHDVTLKEIPGLHIQWPWTTLILSGEKTIETRRYPIPNKYLNTPLAIVETPGPLGRKTGKIKKARIVGVVVFSKCFRYSSKSKWKEDYKSHRVPEGDRFSYRSDAQVWGWEIGSIFRVKSGKLPKKRGIIFMTGCRVSN